MRPRQPCASGDQRVTVAEILALGANVGALARWASAVQTGLIGAADYVLLHNDGVGPGWQRSAGEDAHGLPGFECAWPAVASCACSHYLPWLPHVGPANGITVHGSGGERWLVTHGHQWLRQDTPGTIRQRRHHRWQPFDTGKQPIKRCRIRQQAGHGAGGAPAE